MNKTILFIFLILITISSAPASASGGLISYGGEGIIQVIDLPDTEEFQTQDGQYVDIGYIYKSVEIFFIPVWNYDGRLVGMVEQSDEYIYLSSAQMSEILASSNNEYPVGPYLSIEQRFGGKLVLLIIIFLLISKLIKSSKKKKLSNAFVSTLPTGIERLKDILINGQQFEELELDALDLSVEAEGDVESEAEKNKFNIKGLDFFAARHYALSLISTSVIDMNKTSLEQIKATNDEFFERLLTLKKALSSTANNVTNYVYLTFDKSPSDDDIELIKALKKRKLTSGTHLVPVIVDFEKQEVSLLPSLGALPSKKVLENCFIQAEVETENNKQKAEDNNPSQD